MIYSIFWPCVQCAFLCLKFQTKKSILSIQLEELRKEMCLGVSWRQIVPISSTLTAVAGKESFLLLSAPLSILVNVRHF